MSRFRLRAVLAVAAGAVFLGAAPAAAATLVVLPGLPGAFSTIQAAVDAAGPGDTILIRDKGTPYVEDVRVLGKQDLKVVADRTAMLQSAGGPPSEGIFRVAGSRRITVLGLQIFCDDRATRRGFVLTDVVDVVLDSARADVCSAGVAVLNPATHVVVRRSTFLDDAVGVDVQGANDTLVESTRTILCDTGVQSTGFGTRLIRLRTEDSNSDGVACRGGSNLLVERGGFFGSGVAGVHLTGACRSATVRSSVIGCKPISQPPKFPIPPRAAGVNGVLVDNSGVYTLTSNQVSGCTDSCFVLFPNPATLASPSGGYLAGNLASGCSVHGFQVEAAFDGWVLERNVAQSNRQAGFFVNSSRNVFIRNVSVANPNGFAVGLGIDDRQGINPAENVGIDNRIDAGLIPRDLQ